LKTIAEIMGLSKRFGEFQAVDDVSFSIAEGEFVGLLGPNGAGKTTTIHMLLGLITPTTGTIRMFGMDFASHRREILQQMNFTSPYVAFPNRLTVRENLRVFARLYSLAHPEREVSRMLANFGLERLADKPIVKLSSGENTRVGLCKALMNDPRLLLLDEPTAYLDPEIASQVKESLRARQRSRGMAILYTSHNMAEVEQLCSRVLFLHHGHIIAAGSPIEVTRSILADEREAPALEEVFLHVARGFEPREVEQ
jgi:ABC-2 type transport system ATP-binding protein